MAAISGVTVVSGPPQIGIVKTIIGSVKAVGADGVERTLQAGDRVYPDELIVTGAAGAVIIEFIDGTRLDLAHNASISLDTEVFNPAAADAEAGEVARIQQLIAAGMDPAAAAEAAAAGTGAADEGGASFVVVDFANTQGHVTSGYPTIGIPAPEAAPLENQIMVEGTIQLTPPSPPPPPEQSPPDALDDRFTIHENQSLQLQPVDLLGNDTDPDGNPLNIISVGNGWHWIWLKRRSVLA